MVKDWTTIALTRGVLKELDEVTKKLEEIYGFDLSRCETVSYLIRFYNQKSGKVKESSPQMDGSQ